MATISFTALSMCRSIPNFVYILITLMAMPDVGAIPHWRAKWYTCRPRRGGRSRRAMSKAFPVYKPLAPRWQRSSRMATVC